LKLHELRAQGRGDGVGRDPEGVLQALEVAIERKGHGKPLEVVKLSLFRGAVFG